MTVVAMLVQVLGLGGLFMARALGPLWVLAASARFGAPLGIELVDARHGVAAWLISDELLVGCGFLALAELVAHHVRSTRAFLVRVDPLLKAAVAAVGSLALGVAVPRGLLEGLRHESKTLAVNVESSSMAQLESVAIALSAAVVTLLLALARKSALTRLRERSVDDELGVQRLSAWGEDLWTLAGPLLFLAWPSAALGIGLVALLLALRLRRALRVREEDDKVICFCGQMNHRMAPRCAGCGGRNDAPIAVGTFGQATDQFAENLEQHALALFEVKRCPRCASRLEARDPLQFCVACGQGASSDASFLDDYDRRIRGRVGRTLFITALLGAMPLVGLAPAVFQARRALIVPYARYLARGPSLLARWSLGLAWLLAIVSQLVPGVGALSLPLVSFSSHRAHRAAFLRAARTGTDHDDW